MINKIQTNNNKITNYISSGNTIVDQLGQMDITGDITPKNLYYTVLGKDGNPNRLAIDILSHLIFCYRPYNSFTPIETPKKKEQSFEGRNYDFDKLQDWFDGKLGIQDSNELLKTGTDC